MPQVEKNMLNEVNPSIHYLNSTLAIIEPCGYL